MKDYTKFSSNHLSKKKITTFSKEISATNNKIYKFTTTIAKFFDFFIAEKNLEILKKHEVGEGLIHLYIIHPFNNILHFKITQILKKIIELKEIDLINFYFFDNLAFKTLLNQVVSDYKILQENRSIQKSCYFGFIKDLQKSLTE